MNDPMELRGFAFACPRASALTGQGAVLGCDHCQSDVHDLSELTRGEAIALLARPDLPCVRLTVGLDGRATFRDPPPVAPTHRSQTERPAPRPPRRSSRRVALFGALAGALAAGPVAAAPDAAVEETPAEPERAPTLMATAAGRLAALVADAEADARRAEADARRAARRRSKKKKTPSDHPPREAHRLGGKPMVSPPPDTAEARPKRPGRRKATLPHPNDRAAWRARHKALVDAGKSHREALAVVEAEWRARRAELGL